MMATEKLIEVIVDASTGEVIELELTAERIAEIEAERAIQESEKQARQTIRDSALAKLSAIGLTEEEIAAL
jgi:phage shock protein A